MSAAGYAGTEGRCRVVSEPVHLGQRVPVGAIGLRDRHLGQQGNLAIAVGAHSAAVSGAGLYKNGILNFAGAYGSNSTALAGAGNANSAVVIGSGSKAVVGNGNFNRGSVFGADSIITNGQGSFNGRLYLWVPMMSPPAADPAQASSPGSFNYASVIGSEEQRAISGSSVSAPGNACLATALGDSNNAKATGGNFRIDIAPFF